MSIYLKAKEDLCLWALILYFIASFNLCTDNPINSLSPQSRLPQKVEETSTSALNWAEKIEDNEILQFLKTIEKTNDNGAKEKLYSLLIRKGTLQKFINTYQKHINELKKIEPFQKASFPWKKENFTRSWDQFETHLSSFVTTNTIQPFPLTLKSIHDAIKKGITENELTLSEVQFLFNELFKQLSLYKIDEDSKIEELSRKRIYTHIFGELLNNWQTNPFFGETDEKREENMRWLSTTILVQMSSILHYSAPEFKYGHKLSFRDSTEGRPNYPYYIKPAGDFRVWMRGSNLKKADLGNQRLEDLRNVNLQEANLTGSRFSGLTDTVDLTNAHLQNANFSGAELYRIKMNHADLRGAELNMTTLYDVDLSYADLRGVDLRANLEDTTVTGMKILRSQAELLLWARKATPEQLSQMDITEDLNPIEIFPSQNSVDSSL